MAYLISTADTKLLNGRIARLQNGGTKGFKNIVYQVGENLEVQTLSGSTTTLQVLTGACELSGLVVVSDTFTTLITNNFGVIKTLVLRVSMEDLNNPSLELIDKANIVQDNLYEKPGDGVSEIMLADITFDEGGNITNIDNSVKEFGESIYDKVDTSLFNGAITNLNDNKIDKVGTRSNAPTTTLTSREYGVGQYGANTDGAPSTNAGTYLRFGGGTGSLFNDVLLAFPRAIRKAFVWQSGTGGTGTFEEIITKTSGDLYYANQVLWEGSWGYNVSGDEFGTRPNTVNLNQYSQLRITLNTGEEFTSTSRRANDFRFASTRDLTGNRMTTSNIIINYSNSTINSVTTSTVNVFDYTAMDFIGSAPTSIPTLSLNCELYKGTSITKIVGIL